MIVPFQKFESSQDICSNNHVGKIMREALWIIRVENEAVAQIATDYIVTGDNFHELMMCLSAWIDKIVFMTMGRSMWLQPLSQSMGDIFDIVVFNPDLYCSLR